MVDSRLTILQSHTKSLWTACLLGLLHDVDTPECLVVIWVHTQSHRHGHTFKYDIRIYMEK